MTTGSITMRAAVSRAIGEPFSVEEVTLEGPRDGEVRVRVTACAICHSDVSYVLGEWTGVLPAVYGHEVAGTVEDVGPGVTGIAPGQHVVVALLRSCGRCYFCARGEPTLCSGSFGLERDGVLRASDGTSIVQGLRTAGFAEQVLVDASQVVPVPAELPAASAALLACGVMTGLGAVVNTAGARPGDGVVVVGVGGVGLNSVQGARLVGADPIVAVDLAADKREAALALGATHALDPTSVDLADEIRGLTGGRGADHVVVTVGAGRAIEDGLALARRGGDLIVVGMPPEGVTIEVDPMTLAHDGKRIIGSKVGSSRPDVDIPWLAALAVAGRLQLDPLVSGRFTLDRIDDAVAASARGDGLRNVVIP